MEKPGAKRFAKLTEKEPELNRPSFNRAPGQRQPALTLREGSVRWDAMWWGRPPESLPRPDLPHQRPLRNGR